MVFFSVRARYPKPLTVSSRKTRVRALKEAQINVHKNQYPQRKQQRRRLWQQQKASLNVDTVVLFCRYGRRKRCAIVAGDDLPSRLTTSLNRPSIVSFKALAIAFPLCCSCFVVMIRVRLGCLVFRWFRVLRDYRYRT